MKCATPKCANERKDTPNSLYCPFCSNDRALEQNRAFRKREAMKRENEKRGIGLGQDAVAKRMYKSKPVTPLDIPNTVTPEQAAAFINELERHCCGVRYWLRRRFFGVSVAYWVTDSGDEFTHCPRCGQAVN